MIRSKSVGRCLLRLAPVILLTAAAACGPFRRGAGPPQAAIVFTNESLAQADVFIVMQGLGRRRIGTVMAGQTENLTVPADLTTRGGTMNVVARLLAHPRVAQTGPVSILAGERYEVRLTSSGGILSFLPARQ